jgi:SAM-dependent methyltransferase
MVRPPDVTVPAEYFDGIYDDSDDPYEFATKWYERRKYALSVALLPRERYGNAFEPGCSIGVLTRMLAERCDRLLSCDGARSAVRLAAERVKDQPNVEVRHGRIPRDWPPGDFDLIVVSEVLYYFADLDLARVLDLATAALRPGGHLLAVHWRGETSLHPRGGDDAHRALAARPELSRVTGYRERDFLADVFEGHK